MIPPSARLRTVPTVQAGPGSAAAGTMPNLTISPWNDLEQCRPMPDVSIIIPVHNRVELLRQTLISCALQTYEDCEILVIDDDSEQNVSAVVEWVRAVFGGSYILRYI